jgi:hypothetical protein
MMLGLPRLPLRILHNTFANTKRVSGLEYMLDTNKQGNGESLFFR